MRVLIIAEQLPEEVAYYLLPSLSKAEAAILQVAHANYMNTEISDKVSQALANVWAALAPSDQKKGWADGAQQQWLDKEWHKYKLNADKIMKLNKGQSVKVDALFIVGFVC